MPVKYSCDNCGRDIENHLQTVKIMGGKEIDILCENRWGNIEKEIIAKREVSNVNKR